MTEAFRVYDDLTLYEELFYDDKVKDLQQIPFLPVNKVMSPIQTTIYHDNPLCFIHICKWIDRNFPYSLYETKDSLFAITEFILHCLPKSILKLEEKENES